MDHASTLQSGTYHLRGIRKTLRRLYAPASEPNESILRALQALDRLERVESVRIIAETAVLAPAA